MYKFILIDDEPLIRRGILKKIATFEGEIIFAGEADNGEDALTLISEVDPDIIFTDMRMPVLDGKSLLKILQKDYPDKKIIVISGYTNFEYMQEAISANVVGYLLKPFNREELFESLRKAISLLETTKLNQGKISLIEAENEQINYSLDIQTLYNAMIGVHKTDQALIVRSGYLKSLAGTANYLLCLIYSTEFLKNPEKGLLSDKIAGVFSDFIYIPHRQSEHMGFLLLFFPKIKDSDIPDFISKNKEDFIELIRRYSPFHFVAGMSSIKNNIRELNSAYQETISALNRFSIAKENFSISIFNNDVYDEKPVLWNQSEKLLFYLESGNTPKVSELTGEYFAFLSKNTSTPLSSIKYSCQKLMQEAWNGALDCIGLTLYNSLNETYEKSIDTLFDLDSIQGFILQNLTNLSEIMSRKNIYSSRNMIENIKTYIQRNYSRELTLEKVASLFFINPSYCCFLFKEKVGENYSDYINKVRIHKAMELLKNSDDKIYKIAKATGYDNPKYFFRVFKKITGHTPEEYRMSQ